MRTIITAPLALLIALCAVMAMRPAAAADAPKVPAVTPGIYWTNGDGSVLVFLAGNGATYQMDVVSDQEITATYHTSINSLDDVTTPLTPIAGSAKSVKHYTFTHSFTKMTIWMSLTFTVNGKAAEELTRSFYDGIDVKNVRQEEKTPLAIVYPAVTWTGQENKATAFLVEQHGYRLVLVADTPMDVAYLTSRNSGNTLRKSLTMTPTAIKSVTTSDFKHSFSRTTIWMGLEFSIKGTVATDLTRVFYDGIGTSVANEGFIR